MNRRSLQDVALVGLVSAVVGGFTWAQVIVTGVFPDKECVPIASCPSASTTCPTPGSPCYYCTSPQTQKRCLVTADTECTETAWGPENGCGIRYDGTCPSAPNWPSPCNGPFTTNTYCPMLMCFNTKN